MAIKLSEYSMMPHRVDTGGLIPLEYGKLAGSNARNAASYLSSVTQLGEEYVTELKQVRDIGEWSRAGIGLKRLEESLVSSLPQWIGVGETAWNDEVKKRAEEFLPKQSSSISQEKLKVSVEELSHRSYALLRSQEQFAVLDDSKREWESSLEDAIQLGDSDLFQNHVKAGENVFIDSSQTQQVINQGLNELSYRKEVAELESNPFLYLKESMSRQVDDSLIRLAHRRSDEIRAEFANTWAELCLQGKQLSESSMAQAKDMGVISPSQYEHYVSRKGAGAMDDADALYFMEKIDADQSVNAAIAELDWLIAGASGAQLTALISRRRIMNEVEASVRHNMVVRLQVMRRSGVWGDLSQPDDRNRYVSMLNNLANLAEQFPQGVDQVWNDMLDTYQAKSDQSWLRYVPSKKKGVKDA